ncbi:UDP-N-acetylmuramoyl-tripeptide--D-alanyl-D-alanine ligase [Paenibacillus sp. H1-7]|uniref:UDP-N-acetylmuramoyl-tripeptide--D-alanyl-D- alanine ligase n=1 Tax=Paenibacillus sp. H1-7 TaxID=2282849 RepID=UPI001EF7A632|nr:UDP-N-acetylmuramoyl-tripeptide--D-alanyl-D-alanine ligase [Paenibacillus sp. H1-7]ULL13965.1 UDP-N-acetylmuramoyl-tripeptide--D-alanyl-D-alanine ligase [Paenibacillus sp. H1-7]
MICRKLKVIEQMAGGHGLSSRYDELEIRGVTIDSRNVTKGNLFVPIVRQLNGHDYVQEAIAGGAVASLWQTSHPNPPQDVPLIFVEDSLEALQQLAAAYRRELPVKVIGITGSNGKTTTKDMINSVAATTYRVHKTAGNLNSQIGVPLTLLQISDNDDVAVIEMGMSERGQIERLSRMCRPDTAIITMIGVSHLSSLGSRENIAEAKLEIVSGMTDEGVLIYSGDEPLLVNRIEELQRSKPFKAVRFGERPSNDIRAETVETDSEGSSFTVGSAKYRIPLLGAHNVQNALAAAAAASQLGIPADKIAEGFQALTLTGMRMEKIMSPHGFLIINDAWNASPISMAAAIDAMKQLEGFSRRVLVLGDMLELGEQEEEFHRDIGRNIDPDAIDFVFTIGSLGKYIALEAEKRFPPGGGRVRSFEDKEELVKELKCSLKERDAILLKGSRGMQLETIVPFLL